MNNTMFIMIKKINDVLHIQTKDTSYIFNISKLNHLHSMYYGKKINYLSDYSPLMEKWPYALGSSVRYDESIDIEGSLDCYSLEYSFIVMEKNPVLDFKYDRYEIKNNITSLNGLPTPHGADGELSIFLIDEVVNVELELRYVVFYETNVIARTVIIKNLGEEVVNVEKLMSFNLDMNNQNF